MGERKVLNNYYSPDFDPSKLPKIRRPNNQQISVTMTLPMSIQCNTCRSYIYKGTKFNTRKEDVIGEKYLQIRIFRFYFKCTTCSAELTIKTDPQNSNYVVESGATRNFEPLRAENERADKLKRKRDAEEMGDAMKALENRISDSKREMDVLASLDEIKSMKSRQATVSVDAMLEALHRQEIAAEEKEKSLDEEDEALIRSIFHNRDKKEVILRISYEDVNEDRDLFQFAIKRSEGSSNNLKKRKLSEQVPIKLSPIDALKKDNFSDNGENPTVPGTQSYAKLPPRFQVIRKTVAVSNTRVTAKSENKPEECTGLQSLCQNYDSDDE